MNDNDFFIWFCGFFDGEGCFNKTGKYIGLDVVQTLRKNREVLKTFKRIKKLFGGTLLVVRSKKENTNHSIRWKLKNRILVSLMLKKMIPFLCIRRLDAIVADKFIDDFFPKSKIPSGLV